MEVQIEVQDSAAQKSSQKNRTDQQKKSGEKRTKNRTNVSSD